MPDLSRNGQLPSCLLPALYPLQSGGAQRGRAVALRRRPFLGRRRPAAQRSRSRACPFHPAPLVQQFGFIAPPIFLSAPRTQNRDAMAGLQEGACFRFSAPVLVYRLSLSASLLALAVAPLKTNFFLAAPPSSPGICGRSFIP